MGASRLLRFAVSSSLLAGSTLATGCGHEGPGEGECCVNPGPVEVNEQPPETTGGVTENAEDTPAEEETEDGNDEGAEEPSANDETGGSDESPSAPRVGVDPRAQRYVNTRRDPPPRRRPAPDTDDATE